MNTTEEGKYAATLLFAKLKHLQRLSKDDGCRNVSIGYNQILQMTAEAGRVAAEFNKPPWWWRFLKGRKRNGAKVHR